MSTQTVFVTAGATSKTIDISLVQKAAATSPGDPITALAFNTSSLTAYYRKGATGTATPITLATQTVGGAWSSGGFVETSSANAPGQYRFDVPDTVIATAGIATVTFNGAANMATHTVYFVITAIDLYDSVRGGMTALPNAAAAASGGLHILGTNATAVSYTGGMTISNASGSALSLTSSGGNGAGLAAAGNGSGAGISATAGATGVGLYAAGGSTSGSAIRAVGTAGNAVGLDVVGQGSGAGFKATGGATGNGATFAGGSTSGHGLQATTVGSNEIDADITGTLSAVATGVQTAIAGKVWDEATSSHVTAGSFGALSQTPNSGTAQAGAAGTITLASAASSTDSFYNNCIVQIISGTGAGQARFISSYVGSTRVATVNANWVNNPDATSVYVVIPFASIPGATAPTASQNADAVWQYLTSNMTTTGSIGVALKPLRQSTAQGGTSSSITLDSGASATNDAYKLDIVTIIAGTGAGQSRQISAYTGSSKVATVGVNWTIAPDNTSVFILTPLGVDAATVAAIASAVWEETRAAHATAGTMGEYVTADAQRIKGDATAATNAKNTFDGATGYGFTNCTIPTVTAVTTVNGLAANSVTAAAVATDAVTEIQSGLATSAALTSAAGDITTILGQTGTTGVVVATASKTGYTLSNVGIDSLFTRQLTESYAADGSAPTVAQALMQIQQMLTEFSISSTTMTVKKLDGSTSAFTLTLNSASAPTAITRAT